MAASNSPKIAILLSTFNGARWLPQLMQSLAMQSLPFELIWRDDGSSDRTLNLVRDFEWQRLREVQHSSEGQNIGACASFGLLMEAALLSDAALLFFAGQDDVWRPFKLVTVVSAYAGSAPSKPQLIHHDLRVVDQNGEEIAPSLWRFMRLDAKQTEVARFFFCFSVTGCATAVNRALLKIATPVPSAALMHDWWLGLIASVFGQIRVEEAVLVDYRQHAGNALGAKGFFHGLNPFTNWVAGWRRGNKEYRALFPQGRAMLALLRIHPDVAQRDLASVKAFVSIPDLPVSQRCREANRLGLRERSTLLWLVFMLRVALTKVRKPEA